MLGRHTKITVYILMPNPGFQHVVYYAEHREETTITPASCWTSANSRVLLEGVLSDNRVLEGLRHDRGRTLRQPMISAILICSAAILYYRLGDFEYSSGFPLALLSVIVSFFFLWLGGGLFFLIVGQGAIFFGMTVYNMVSGRSEKGAEIDPEAEFSREQKPPRGQNPDNPPRD